MNFTHIWKVVSGLSMTDKLLIFLLFTGTILGALIALWNVLPLAGAYCSALWQRHVRRRSRRRRHAARAYTRASLLDQQVLSRGMAPPARETRMPRNAWLAVAGFSVVSVLGGIALGSLLSRPVPTPGRNAQLTEAVHDPARLRIDYELRKR
jgi:hypothetical protein